jgi:DNA replication protein DnaD
MARPQKEGLDYFPLDTDADTDEKVQAVIYLHGNEGFAVWIRLLMRIYKTPAGELDISDTETRQILARNLSITLQKFDRILDTCLKRGLFDAELFKQTHRLSSPGIQKRLKVVLDKRAEMKTRYAQKQGVSGGISDAEMGVETPQSKSKVKDKDKRESKDKEKTTTPTPSSLSSSDIDGVMERFTENYISCTREELGGVLMKYGSELTIKAAREAAIQNNLSFPYVVGVLKNWAGS